MIVRFLFAAVLWILGMPLHAQGVAIVDQREYPETGAQAPGMRECNANWLAPTLSDGTTLHVSSHSVAGHPRIALYAADPDVEALHIVADWPAASGDFAGGYSVSEIDMNQDDRAEVLVIHRSRHSARYELYGRDHEEGWRLILTSGFGIREQLRAHAQDVEWGFRARYFEGQVVMQTRGDRFPEIRCHWWPVGQDLWQYRTTTTACPDGNDNNQNASRVVLIARVLPPYWRAQRDRLRAQHPELDVDIETLFDCVLE